jgi:hypothetical protein
LDAIKKRLTGIQLTLSESRLGKRFKNRIVAISVGRQNHECALKVLRCRVELSA